MAIYNIQEYMHNVGEQARQASRLLSRVSTADKNYALNAIADDLDKFRSQLLSENQKDLDAGREKGLDSALLDRLALNDTRIDGMIEGLRQIAALADPIGEIFDMKYQPTGIQVGRMRVPLGVVGIIYESRPNVTADAAALCLKSGNATVLRGGSEAFHSNQAIASCVQRGLAIAGLPETAVQVIETTDRDAVGEMISMPDYIDVIIPRGGKSLIERISHHAKVPVIKHLDGICHVYIDADADLEKAHDITINAKTQRYGTCNTLETLLVDKSVAHQILPRLEKTFSEKEVTLKGCAETQKIISTEIATDEDWDTEYLAPILSIRIVDDVEMAMDHIAHHSSAHTETIITENYSTARIFLQAVDSSSVMVNASTRFADGFEYGLGAEIGISTDKFHARGPVGLEGLTSVKYIVLGDGHIRQ